MQGQHTKAHLMQIFPKISKIGMTKKMKIFTISTFYTGFGSTMYIVTRPILAYVAHIFPAVIF